VAKKSEFADQSMQGVHHLQGLTGTRPGRWEKEKKFLSRVLVPEDAHVKIGAPKRKNQDM
jgi:hypothetical protein